MSNPSIGMDPWTRYELPPSPGGGWYPTLEPGGSILDGGSVSVPTERPLPLNPAEAALAALTAALPIPACGLCRQPITPTTPSLWCGACTYLRGELADLIRDFPLSWNALVRDMRTRGAL